MVWVDKTYVFIAFDPVLQILPKIEENEIKTKCNYLLT